MFVHFPKHPHHVNVTASGCNYLSSGKPELRITFQWTGDALSQAGSHLWPANHSCTKRLKPPIITHSLKPEKAALFG
jgi:hypothetical protein